MELSAIGTACLIAREGRRLAAYADGVGRLTIGIGCTTIAGRPVRRGDTITAAECDALFAATWPAYAAAVAAVVPAGVALEDHEADALISFCYNIGTRGFLGSTVARLLGAGSLGAVPAAMLMWARPASIVTRRQAEADQFGTPYAVALPRATSTAPRPVPVPATARSAGAAPAHPAQGAPVIEPVAVPPAHPRLAGLGAWVDRVFAPSREHAETVDLAARG